MNQTDPSDNHHPLSSRETGQHRDSLASNVSPLNELVPGKHSAILGATKGILTHSKKSTSFHKSHMSNKSDLLGHEKAKDTNKADKYANIGGNKVVPLSRKPVVEVGSRMEIAEVESPSPHRRNSELREQKTILAAAPAQVSRLWAKVKANRKRLLMMEQMATQLDHLQFEGSTVSRKPVTECSISHEGTVHKWLQVVRSVTLLFMMFVIPIQFAFKDSTDGINSAGFKAGLGMVDMLYLVRTVLDAFFITYQAPSGYVVTDDVLIFQRFRKEYVKLFYRTVVLVPWYLIDSSWGLIKCVCFLEMSTAHYAVTFVIEEIFKWVPYSLAVSKLKSFSILIGSNTITILVLANLLCCLWIRINGYVTTNNKSDYINAQYFLFTTASTIGYGDILVQHQRTDTVSGRYAFATFMILVCLIFFAYVQSLINSIRTEWTLVDDRLQGLLEEFVDWMTNRSMASGGRIPFKFETTLIDFFDYLYTNDIYSTVSMNGFIDLLGEKLKLQLTKMTARGLVEKYVFLADIDDEIAAEIILNSEAVSFVEGDKVLTRGQLSEAVYLMLKGKVSVEYPPEDLKIDVLEEKEHFGDICVLSKKSHFDYVCKTSVVCLQVKKSTLDEVLLKSRHTLSKLVSNSRLRLRYMLFMKNKAVAAKQKYLQMKNLKAAMFNKEEFDLHWIENILKSEKFKDELEDGLPGFAGSNEAFRDAETEQNPHNNCGSNPLIDADARLATEGDELLRDFVHENLMLNGNGVSNQQADVSIQEIPQDKLRTPVKLQTFSMKPKPRDTTEEKKFAPSLQAKSAFDPTDAASVASTGIKGVSLKKNWSTAVRPPPTTETEEPEKDEPDFSKMPVSKLKHLKTVFTKTKLAQPSKPNMVEMLAQMAVSKDELETSFNSIDKEDSKHAADAIKNLLDKADAVTQHKLMEVQKTEKVVFGVTVGEALFDLDDEQDDSCEMDDPIASVSSESIRLKIEESIKMAEAKLQHVKCKFRVFFKNFQGDFEFIEDEIRVKTNKLIRIEANHSNKSLPLSEPLSV